MYDNVTVFVANPTLDINIFDVGLYLRDMKKITHENGYTQIVGKCESLNVKISITGITITGSLSRFYHGSNILPLDKHTTREAVDKLCKALHYDIRAGDIKSLEVAHDFMLHQPIEDYLKRFGACDRLKQWNVKSSMYYRNGDEQRSKTLIFYDKAKEMRRRKEQVPDVYEGQNVLRYEMKLQGRLAQQTSFPAVTIGMLSDNNFYSKLKAMYIDNYKLIKKIAPFKTEDMNTGLNKSQATKIFFSQLIKENPKRVDELLNCLDFSSRNEKSKFKSHIKALQGFSTQKGDDILIKELDDEFRRLTVY